MIMPHTVILAVVELLSHTQFFPFWGHMQGCAFLSFADSQGHVTSSFNFFLKLPSWPILVVCGRVRQREESQAF